MTTPQDIASPAIVLKGHSFFSPFYCSMHNSTSSIVDIKTPTRCASIKFVLIFTTTTLLRFFNCQVALPAPDDLGPVPDHPDVPSVHPHPLVKFPHPLLDQRAPSLHLPAVARSPERQR
mmetsp:Transcript_26931/g.64646  ORF Transcript_26931/g.64646 Transcript_26931/m.64646 type:complete len:119 (-) Transcript_26931:388-744(-)